MAFYREQRGEYLIEAGAFHLPDKTWQPRLTMTRLPQGKALSRSQAFPGLCPAFETAKSAVRFAVDLGRSMADHGSSRLTV